MRKETLIEMINIISDKAKDKDVSIDAEDVLAMLEECDSIEEAREWAEDNI